MTAIWNNEKIKVFVKNTLGCGCPEKVFEKIDVSRLVVAEHEGGVTRLVVGDTLLIYIIRSQLSDKFADNVESIGLAGKKDRDKNNCNRFRLVVSGLEDSDRQEKASKRFSKAFSRDEKMHLHFVDRELLAGL